MRSNLEHCYCERFPSIDIGFGLTAPSSWQSVANSLQSTYWNPGSGLYNDGELWTDAVSILLNSIMRTYSSSSFLTECVRKLAQPYVGCWDDYLGERCSEFRHHESRRQPQH
jgi:hypothetical protein